MNISTNNSNLRSTTRLAQSKVQAQPEQMAQPQESVTLSESGRNPILKAVQGAGIGFANYALGGGTWWKAGLIGGTMRGASFYLEGRIAAHQAVKNGDLPGGLGVGTVMGRMGATVGFLSGAPTFAAAAAIANLCGGGPMAHTIAGAVGNVLTS